MVGGECDERQGSVPQCVVGLPNTAAVEMAGRRWCSDTQMALHTGNQNQRREVPRHLHSAQRDGHLGNIST